MSDEWAAYRRINSALGYEHHTVNHSENFVHPDNRDVHTQTIESTWNRLRVFLEEHGRHRTRETLPGLINEFLVRRSFTRGTAESLKTNFSIITEAADEWLSR